MTNHITTTPLVYKGEIIRDKGDQLSLTNMHKAAGAPSNQEPAQWMRSASAEAFIEAVSINMGKSHNEIVVSKRGGNAPGTWAHWQIAFAYAKYLSPEFHMWCNQVVRERMEGLQQQAVATLTPEVLEMIRRDDGISRMLAHKVTGIESTVQTLATAISAIASIVQPSHPGLYVSGKTSGEIWEAYNLPKGIKNAPRWLGNRLAEMGCQIDDCRTVQVNRSRFRMFDADKAAICMKNGLLHKAKVYASERMGQSALRLVGGREA